MDKVSNFVLFLAAASMAATLSWGYEYDSDYLVPPKCKPCDATSCPELKYCAGKVLKDNCGCCPRCSSKLFQPHSHIEEEPEPEPVIEKADACMKRKCPKFKVCMINMQGLPICTCPSLYVCKSRRARRDKNEEMVVCGTDGMTYETKCHLRIANCNSKKRIKRKHRGKCTPEDAPENKAGLEQSTVNDIQDKDDDFGMSNSDNKWIERIKKARRKKLRRKKKKDRKKRKGRKDRQKNKLRKRMKRRNEGFSVYSDRYGYLLGKHTTWGKSQVRKSKI